MEHHREIIALADHIVDMGPEAGINGGQIMYQGSYEGLLKADTVTRAYAADKNAGKMEYRKPTGWYQLEHANLHNLKNVNVKLPLGVMTVIAGVAGSGKMFADGIFYQPVSGRGYFNQTERYRDQFKIDPGYLSGHCR